ncbi:hypothetical protein AMTRI_Chr06g176980 [Amborella trichopoda]
MGDCFEELSAVGVKRCLQREYEIVLENNNEEEEIAGESAGVCAICLDKIEVENVKVLQCSHMFHAQCITISVARKSSCPSCTRTI